MTDKEKIRAEIEKKIKVFSPFTHQGSDTCGKIIRQLESLVSFIDSLPEEPVSEDLEEAAIMHYKDVMEYEVKTGLKPSYMTSFKAGAKWQKEQMMKDVILETTVVIEKDGSAEDFNEVECSYYEDSEILEVPKWAKDGDKVKVIVIKED